MVGKLIRGAILLIVIASARADLLLTPRAFEQTLDGGKLKLLAFADDGREVTYQPPPGWEYGGNASQLTLRPPGRVQAAATVRRIRLPQPESFGEEDIKKLLAEVPSFVPEGSEQVAVVAQEKNPLLINRQETFQVVVEYTYYGEAFKSSILFLNRGADQIRFQLICRTADFNDLQRAFQQSHYTWHNL